MSDNTCRPTWISQSYCSSSHIKFRLVFNLYVKEHFSNTRFQYDNWRWQLTAFNNWKTWLGLNILYSANGSNWIHLKTARDDPSMLQMSNNHLKKESSAIVLFLFFFFQSGQSIVMSYILY